MKFLKLFIVGAAFLIGITSVAQTQTFNPHPRLFLTPERIERIQTQHIAGDSYEWRQVQRCADRNSIDGAVAKAMLYRLTNDTDAALEAVLILSDYVSSGPVSVTFNNAGPFFNKWALCYDWLSGFPEFDLIKADIVAWTSEIEQKDWDYYMTVPYMNGHQKAIWGAPLWGMATAGENPDANIYIESGEERWKRTRFLFGYGPDALATWKDGILPSGNDYGSGTLKNTLVYMIAAEDAYGKNTFDEAPYVKNMMKAFLHQVYYDPDYIHRTEHGHNAQKRGGYFYNDALTSLMLQERFPDSDEAKMIQRWFSEAPGAYRYPARDDRYFSYWGLLFKDYSIEEMDIDLPLGYLSEWPGVYVYRSDYNTQAPPELYWTFRSGNQVWFNQNHYDNGNIFVSWNGDGLIIDAGLYDGGGGINILNYHQATIGHNTALVKDTLEIYGWNQLDMAVPTYQNSGGQRLGYKYTLEDAPIDGWIPTEIENTFPKYLHDAADIVELSETNDLVYILSNNTNSYMNIGWEDAYPENKLNGYGAFYQPKVEVVEREVAHTDGLIVLFDRVVTTNEDYDTYITYHSIWEPTPQEGGYLVEGDNGQIWISVLSPSGTSVEKIGGPGYEYWVNGVNWDPYPNSHNDLGGNWRLEYRTEGKQTDNFFTTVLQPGNVGDEKVQVVSIKGTSTRVVTLANNTVFSFLKDRESAASASYKLEDVEGSLNHVIANLNPATEYSVYNQGKLIESGHPTENGLYTLTSDLSGYWMIVETSKIEGHSPALATLLGMIDHLEDFLK